MGVTKKLLVRIRKLEAENTRLNEEADWLAEHVPRDKDVCIDCMFGPDCDTCRRKFWRKAAREAVEKENEAHKSAD